jgi:hypothetical protein
MNEVTSALYRAARFSASMAAIVHGHTTRRAKNIVVGRALASAGFWNRLWR